MRIRCRAFRGRGISKGCSQNNRQGDQDLYSGVTMENRYKGNWHNLLRYGIARKREQEQEFAAGGNFLEFDPGNYGAWVMSGTW